MIAVNFPFIKSIHFEELNIPNDDKANKKYKQYFYLFINCRNFRSMKNIQNSYCFFSLESHILTIKANQNFIEICLDILNQFENSNLEINLKKTEPL